MNINPLATVTLTPHAIGVIFITVAKNDEPLSGLVEDKSATLLVVRPASPKLTAW